MNDKISEAAGLLRRASDKLLSVDSSSTTLHSVVESVTRARNRMDRSRQGGALVLIKDYGLRFLEEEQKVNRSEMCKPKASKKILSSLLF